MSEDKNLRFSIEVGMGATVSIKMPDGAINWIKPEMKSSISVDGIPDQEEIELYVQGLRGVVDEVLTELVQDAVEKTRAIGT